MSRRRKPSRGDQVAAEALTWVGTPLHEQQAAKGAGCDCKGLVWGVARELKFPEAENLYATCIAYDLKRSGGVPLALLKEGLAATFDRVPDGAPLQPGDVLLLRHRGIANHLAIVASDTTAVHAQIEPTDKVKEATLRSLLKLCPLVSAWRWRAIERKAN